MLEWQKGNRYFRRQRLLSIIDYCIYVRASARIGGRGASGNGTRLLFCLYIFLRTSLLYWNVRGVDIYVNR